MTSQEALLDIEINCYFEIEISYSHLLSEDNINYYILILILHINLKIIF